MKGTLWRFFLEKKSHNAENTKRGTLWDFSKFCCKTSRKLKGALCEKIVTTKVPQYRKKLEGWTFSLARYCMLREKKEHHPNISLRTVEMLTYKNELKLRTSDRKMESSNLIF